jgi:hypothetical protein
MSCLGKLFSGGKDLSLDLIPADPAGEPAEGGDQEYTKLPVRVIAEDVVVRRPELREPVYTAQVVDVIDSLWLRECGMVRVKSDDAGGCHIVPKSNIQEDEWG